VMRLVGNGEVTDGKTLVCLMFAQCFRR